MSGTSKTGPLKIYVGCKLVFRRLGEIIDARDTNQEIGLGFVSCSWNAVLNDVMICSALFCFAWMSEPDSQGPLVGHFGITLAQAGGYLQISVTCASSIFARPPSDYVRSTGSFEILRNLKCLKTFFVETDYPQLLHEIATRPPKSPVHPANTFRSVRFLHKIANQCKHKRAWHAPPASTLAPNPGTRGPWSFLRVKSGG